MSSVVERLRVLLKLLEHGDRVHLTLTSQDPELKRYLDGVQALASCASTSDGQVFLQLDDLANVPLWGAALEELIHAAQDCKDGCIPLSVDEASRHSRECEAARLLLKNAKRLHLCQQDVEHYTKAQSEFC